VYFRNCILNCSLIIGNPIKPRLNTYRHFSICWSPIKILYKCPGVAISQIQLEFIRDCFVIIFYDDKSNADNFPKLLGNSLESQNCRKICKLELFDQPFAPLGVSQFTVAPASSQSIFQSIKTKLSRPKTFSNITI